jgi:hypothetical protein
LPPENIPDTHFHQGYFGKRPVYIKIFLRQVSAELYVRFLYISLYPYPATFHMEWYGKIGFSALIIQISMVQKYPLFLIFIQPLSFKLHQLKI